MASKEYGRDPKAKLNSNKAHGEDAMQKSRMGDALKESLEQIQNKDSRERWLFGKKQIENTPSRRDNISAEKELNYRQQAANLIQDMGQRLPVNQLTINTAIVYMHRFYMFHSFQAFSRFVMAPTALFLAAKVEEQPRKLEHVIKVCHSCLHPDKPHIDVHSDGYMKQAQELVQNELIMLQTLGFDISIDHPHTHVVKCTQLVKASRDLSQMAYFMATNSLHLTTFCLQYKPTVVSAMCIHLSCKWSNYEIPLSSTGKAYWTYMDPIITESLLESIINEFLKILNLCPTRLRKLRNYKPSQHLRDSSGGSAPSTSKDGQQGKPSSTSSSRVSHGLRLPSGQPPEVPPAANPSANDQMKKHPSMTLAEYKKREKIQLGKQPSTQQEKEIKQEKQHKYNSPHSHPSQRKVPHQVTSASRPNHGNPHSEGQHSRHHIPPPGPQHSQNKAKPHPNTSEHNRSHDRTPQQSTQSAKPDKPGLGIPGLKRTTDQRQHQVSNTSHTMQKHNAHEHKSAKEQSNASTSHHSSTGTSHPRNHEQHVKAMQRLKEEKLQPQEHTGSNSPAVSVAEDENAMMKGIEMKIMEQMKAEKSVMKFQTEGSASLSVPTSNIPGIKHPSQSSANHHTPAVTKEHRGRHSHPGHPSQEKQATSTSHHSMSFSDVKSPGEPKKNPHTMYHYLKQKMQAGPLSAEEKNLLHKLKKKEEERRRKREHKKQKSHHTQPSSEQGGSAEGSSTPSGGGSLTVRIKLPPSSRPVGSSSGSGSEAALEHSPGGTVLPKPGRKRAHGHDSSMDPTLVKQSRKSESHHHQGQSSSQGNASRHKHSRSSSHHQQSKAQQQAGQKIDEAVFQQALVDAVSMVQSGHAGSGNSGNGSASGRVVPTVTLKRTSAHNGSDDNYIAHSSKQEKRRSSSKRSKHSNFDPSTPISATLPEDLFDQEDDESNHQHFDRKCTSGSNRNAADLSSPETGEIRDDEDESVSPLREHVASSLPSSKDWGNTQRKRTANNVSPHYRHRNSAAEFQPRGSDAGYPSESKGCDRVTPLTVKSSYLNETR